MASVTFGRSFRRRVAGDGKPISSSNIIEVEFNLPDKYNEVLRPLFGDIQYGVEILEEKGVITVTLKPKVDDADNMECCD